MFGEGAMPTVVALESLIRMMVGPERVNFTARVTVVGHLPVYYREVSHQIPVFCHLLPPVTIES